MPRGGGFWAPYWPRHRIQLRRPLTGSVDCGPRAVQVAYDFATRGRFVGIERLRELMRVPGPEPTNVFEWSRALTALGVRHERYAGGSWTTAMHALRRGDGVVLAIRYGVLVDRTPWAAGSLSFRGGHAIYVQALRRGRDGRRRTRSFDSLYDGRRREVPDGPRPVRVGVLEHAAGSLAGAAGRFYGLVVPRQTVPRAGGSLVALDDGLELPVDPDAEPEAGVVMPRDVMDDVELEAEDGPDDDDLEL